MDELPGLTVALFVALTGCGGPPPPATAAGIASTEPTGTLERGQGGSGRAKRPLRMWLRTGDSLAFDGSAFESMAGPALVDVTPDGFASTVGLGVRVRGGDDLFLSKFEGQLPDEAREFPTLARGLGLYAAEPVELRLGAPTGPIVARALPGAYLPVLGREGTQVRIALPGYRDAEKQSPSGEYRPVEVFADARALGTAERPQRTPPERDAIRVRDLTLHTAPGEPAFAEASCTPLTVRERRGDWTEVVAHFEGVEVAAFVHRDFDGVAERQARGDESTCPGRVIVRERTVDRGAPLAFRIVTPPVPEGYAPVAGGESLRDPLKSVVRGAKSLYWVSAGDDGELACNEWRFRNGDVSHRFKDVVSSFGFRYWPARGPDDTPGVVLSGPYTQSLKGGGTGIMLCGSSYDIVRAESDRVWVVRGGGRHRYGIAAYHTADAEIWYLDRAACSAALTASRDDALPPERLAEALGPHRRGC